MSWLERILPIRYSIGRKQRVDPLPHDRYIAHFESVDKEQLIASMKWVEAQRQKSKTEDALGGGSELEGGEGKQ